MRLDFFDCETLIKMLSVKIVLKMQHLQRGYLIFINLKPAMMRYQARFRYKNNIRIKTA